MWYVIIVPNTLSKNQVPILNFLGIRAFKKYIYWVALLAADPPQYNFTINNGIMHSRLVPQDRNPCLRETAYLLGLAKAPS